MAAIWRSCPLIPQSALLIALTSVAEEHSPPNLVQNGSAEDLTHQTPTRWSLLQLAGSAGWGPSTTDAAAGRRSVFLRATAFGRRQGKPYLNVGLIQGGSGILDTSQAYPVGPAVAYQYSFALKGDIGEVVVECVQWKGKSRTARDRVYPATVVAVAKCTSSWERHTGVFVTASSASRMVLLFRVYGWKSEGARLGTAYIDDVVVRPLRTENLIANGSFELDEDDDKVPDGWEHHQYGGGEPTRLALAPGARHGRRCVRITNPTDLRIGRCVSQAIALAPHTRYALRACVRRRLKKQNGWRGFVSV